MNRENLLFKGWYRVLQAIMEKITGKSCDTCRFCNDGLCMKNVHDYTECVVSIIPKNYENKYQGGVK